jgi:parvulin-like peptidyl-prolyl isomerase
MALAALLLQSSLLVSPMYMQPEPPEGRALRAIALTYADAQDQARAPGYTREEAHELARSLAERLGRGEDFAGLARSYSKHVSWRQGGILGTFWPGMLPAELDAFLFAAEPDELSPPIETPAGLFLLQRIERDVAWRQIQVRGPTTAVQMRLGQELLQRLRDGEDFATLAREQSQDAFTAARGGVAGIFQRGSRDALLKAAAFAAPVGELVGPLETPFGVFLLQRLDPAQVDPALRETCVVRVRAILVAFSGAAGGDPMLARSSQEAEVIAQDLAARIRAGEDMATLAREWNDDPGGLERAGDLGWILRQSSDIPTFLEKAFLADVGAVLGPVASNAGWVVFRRER